MMRRTIFGIACAVVLAAAGLAPAQDAAKAVSVNGYITDSFCGAKNATAEGKACALKCMEKGAKLVLYSAADKKTFGLDSQEKAKEHVGVEVKVTGTLDEATQMIQVEKIEPAAPKQEKKG